MIRVGKAITAALSMVIFLSSCGLLEPDYRQIELDKKNDEVVRQNMRTVQIAAEKYAGDHGGNIYPSEVDDMFKTYFPSGVEGERPAQVGPVNPFTGINEFPVKGAAQSVEAIRAGKPFKLAPGKIEYSVLENGTRYAIVGGAHDGLSLMDPIVPQQVLVFSNR